MIRISSGGVSFSTFEATVTNPSAYPTATVDTTINHTLGKTPEEYHVYALYNNVLYGEYAPAHPINNGAWYAINVRNIWAYSNRFVVQWGWIEIIPQNTQFKWIIRAR